MPRHARKPDITEAIRGREQARREIDAAGALEHRLEELITADEPAEGLEVFAERLRAGWIEDIDSAPDPEAGASP